MKFRIKKARGYYCVMRCVRGNMYLYTILFNDSTMCHITYQAVQTFATLFNANRALNVWRPHPSYVPTFNRRCAE